MASTIATIDQESEDLDLHVQLCALRYAELDKRLGVVETRIDTMLDKIDTLHADLWKVMIGAVGTIIVSLISSAALIITNLPK